MKCFACGEQIKDCDSRICNNCVAKTIEIKEESGATVDIAKNSNAHSNSKEHDSNKAKKESKSLTVFIIVALILIIATVSGLVYYLKSHAL